jgi:hypothetical protein
MLYIVSIFLVYVLEFRNPVARLGFLCFFLRVRSADSGASLKTPPPEAIGINPLSPALVIPTGLFALLHVPLLDINHSNLG